MSDELRLLAVNWRKKALRFLKESDDAMTVVERESLIAQARSYFDCSYDLDEFIGEDLTDEGDEL